ncbi:MAG: hypothetical protein ABL893_12345 [Hyphomicrobium sp.]
MNGAFDEISPIVDTLKIADVLAAYPLMPPLINAANGESLVNGMGYDPVLATEHQRHIGLTVSYVRPT